MVSGNPRYAHQENPDSIPPVPRASLLQVNWFEQENKMQIKLQSPGIDNKCHVCDPHGGCLAKRLRQSSEIRRQLVQKKRINRKGTHVFREGDHTHGRRSSAWRRRSSGDRVRESHRGVG